MTVWIWNERVGILEEQAGDLSTWSLQAADSWFVQDGRVRALDRHRARFTDAAAQVGLVDVVTDDFWAAVVEKLPATGEWFPRVDVLESPSDGLRVLAFRLRPAPQRTKELRVLVPSYSDPRTTPERKGPDIALLEQLRSQARTEHNCDEVLLLSEDGYVIEGATTSLLWWDGDTLCAPDPALGPLPSITSTLILDEARARSVPTEYRCVCPDDLVDREVWLVNALHGIRRVAQWAGPQTSAADSEKTIDRGAPAATELRGETGLTQRATFAASPKQDNVESSESYVRWCEWLEERSATTQ